MDLETIQPPLCHPKKRVVVHRSPSRSVARLAPPRWAAAHVQSYSVTGSTQVTIPSPITSQGPALVPRGTVPRWLWQPRTCAHTCPRTRASSPCTVSYATHQRGGQPSAGVTYRWACPAHRTCMRATCLLRAGIEASRQACSLGPKQQHVMTPQLDAGDELTVPLILGWAPTGTWADETGQNSTPKGRSPVSHNGNPNGVTLKIS